jgi:hypothetical protein
MSVTRKTKANPSSPPDVGVLAREAVIGFLHDASKATADREAQRAAVAATDAEATVTAPAGNAAGSCRPPGVRRTAGRGRSRRRGRGTRGAVGHGLGRRGRGGRAAGKDQPAPGQAICGDHHRPSRDRDHCPLGGNIPRPLRHPEIVAMYLRAECHIYRDKGQHEQHDADRLDRSWFAIGGSHDGARRRFTRKARDRASTAPAPSRGRV